MKRRITLATALAVLAGLGWAGAASAFTTVGGSTQSNDTGAGCTGTSSCDFIQTLDPSGASYAAPFDGVITGYMVRSGNTVPAGDTVALSIYRPTGSGWLLLAQTPSNTLPPTPGNDDIFAARIPVKAGDVLGLHVHFAGDTAWRYTASGGGVAEITSPAPAVGDTIQPLNLIATANFRLNVSASLERDDDHDGYGDESQDLCPGNGARATVGCSGTTFGSGSLTAPWTSDFTSCPSTLTCVAFNDTIAGQPNLSPVDGVVVRWRLRSFPSNAPELVRLRIARPGTAPTVTMSGTSTGIVVHGLTDPVTLSEQTRIPIHKGDMIGMEAPIGGSIGLYFDPSAGATKFIYPSQKDGETTSLLSGPGPFDLRMSADVEADADGDGYGDETQDACPADPAAHTAPCPGSTSTGPGPGGGASTPVTLSGLSITPSSFRLWRLRNPVGVPRLRFTVSSSATIQISLDRAVPGRRGAARRCVRVTPANRRARACTRWIRIARASVTAGPGASTTALNRLIKRRLLTPGRYRLTATAIAGTSRSSAATVAFRVLKPARRR